MKQFNNDMSRLMICSHEDLYQGNLPLHSRLRLLRAIHCFHREKWSKYLHNHFPNSKAQHSFERFVYHLLKYHLWIIYASWTLHYMKKSLIIPSDISEEHLRLFYEKIHRLQTTIVQLKQIISLIKQTI